MSNSASAVEQNRERLGKPQDVRKRKRIDAAEMDEPSERYGN